MLYYLKLSKQMDFKTMKLRFQNKEENIMCATIKIRRITMGQCYSVNLKIKLKSGSEKRAAEALRAEMIERIIILINSLTLESGRKNWMI